MSSSMAISPLTSAESSSFARARLTVSVPSSMMTTYPFCGPNFRQSMC